MKKTILYIAILIAGAMSLASCNDDMAKPPMVIPETVGNGTAEAPYGVNTILYKIYSGDYDNSKYYIEGIVSKVGEFNASYGNITYYISEDGTSTNEFEVYRGMGLNGAKFTSETDIRVGDHVIVYGQVTLYNSTAETQQNAILVSLNGSPYDKTPQPDPAGEGTAASPYNVARALELIYSGQYTKDKVYVKGIVTSVGEYNSSYGNITYFIADTKGGLNQLEVYRGMGLNGAKFTSADALKPGDEVIILAVLTLYNNSVAETEQNAPLISLNGSSYDIPDTPDNPDVNPGEVSGSGTESDPWSVAKVMSIYESGSTGTTGWATGYIVGSCVDKTFDSATFTATGASTTNIIIAATPGETNYNNCIPVQLPTGTVRESLNLSANPGNLGKKVTLMGSIEKYFGVAGIKTVTDFKLDGNGNVNPPKPDDPATGGIVYTGLVDNCDDWTIDNVDLPDGATYVWSWKVYNNSGYLNGSAYVGGNLAAEAYAYHTLDLSGYKTASVTFDHAAKFQTTLQSLCGFVVREQGASSWTKLSIPTWPEAGAWTFVNSGNINLNAYAGKKVDIGFIYKSTTSGADTWEIKNLKVSASK